MRIYRLVLHIGDVHLVAKKEEENGRQQQDFMRLSHVKHLKDCSIYVRSDHWYKRCWACEGVQCEIPLSPESGKEDAGPLCFLLSCRQAYVSMVQ